jgi:O-antigen/teichoic acid export membrane protein
VTQIELVQTSSLLLIIWFFTSRFGTVGAALAWLPAIVSVQILCIYFIWNIFHDPLQEARKSLVVILIITAISTMVSSFATRIFPNLLGLVLAGMLAALLTGMLLWLGDHRFALGLRRNILIAFPQIASIFKMRNTEIS